MELSGRKRAMEQVHDRLDFKLDVHAGRRLNVRMQNRHFQQPTSGQMRNRLKRQKFA